MGQLHQTCSPSYLLGAEQQLCGEANATSVVVVLQTPLSSRAKGWSRRAEKPIELSICIERLAALARCSLKKVLLTLAFTTLKNPTQLRLQLSPLDTKLQRPRDGIGAHCVCFQCKANRIKLVNNLMA